MRNNKRVANVLHYKEEFMNFNISFLALSLARSSSVLWRFIFIFFPVMLDLGAPSDEDELLSESESLESSRFLFFFFSFLLFLDFFFCDGERSLAVLENE